MLKVGELSERPYRPHLVAGCGELRNSAFWKMIDWISEAEEWKVINMVGQELYEGRVPQNLVIAAVTIYCKTTNYSVRLHLQELRNRIKGVYYL
jgi:hypothetical protein